MSGLLIALFKAAIYIIVGFALGALAGFITRKALKFAFLALLSVGAVMSADLAGFVDTGIDWGEFFESALQTVGFIDFANGVVETFTQAADSAMGNGGSPFNLGPMTAGNPFALIFLALFVVPFVLGFLKALNPS